MTTESPVAPYAPAKSVLSVIERYRDRGLPAPLTADALATVGVARTMAGWAHSGLRFLGLIDGEGNRLEPFERLKRATTDEYPTILAEIVRNAYLPVFNIVDPAKDNEIKVADAFRQYEPAAQRERMVALFYALCEVANIVPPRVRRAVTQVDSAQPRPQRNVKLKTPLTAPLPPEPTITDDLRVITALIQQLPKDRNWSKARREKWVATMSAAVDLIVEVAKDQKEETPQH